MLLYSVIVSVSFLHLTYAFSEAKQCKPLPGKTIPQTDVQFGDCVTPPCILKRGENTIIEMIFTADDNYGQVVVNLFATMMGMKHGYPGLDGADGCSSLYLMPDKTKVSCPIEKGKTYMFSFAIPVKPSFPKVTAPIHFGLKDKASKNEAACFELTIKIA